MSDNNALNDILNVFSDMEGSAKYIMDVEYQFYSADNDAEAVRLAIEAKEKGYSHCLFDYVIGFCFNNGRGGLPLDKEKAGHFFFESAETHDANGEYYNDKHADESRVILTEDYAINGNQFCVLNTNKAIEYCTILLGHNYHPDDALLYLTMIFAMPKFGCQNIEKAIKYCDKWVDVASDPDNKAKAVSMRQQLEGLRPKQKRSFGGFFGRH